MAKRKARNASVSKSSSSAKEKPLMLKISSALLGIEGVLSILGGLMMLLLGGSMMSISGLTDSGMFSGLIGVAGIIVLLIGVVLAFVALQLYNGVRWAKLAASILAVLGLLSFPVGTIIGIVVLYSLWADKETKAVFE